MSKNTPAIILSRPQMGENIGAAARAMANFGLSDLRLVDPRDGWPNKRVVDMASGAFDHIPAPQIFDSLEDAIADLQCVYATTARPRDMIIPVLTPAAAAQDAQKRFIEGENSGFVFGAERTGLTNDETALCTAIIQIPTNPDFSSLNLAQAVLLVAHHIFDAQDDTADYVLQHGNSAPATRENFENFFGRLEDELENGGFFSAKDLKPTMVRNIRNMFSRADLSEQEVNTLQGIVSALIGKKKRAKKAG
ncbi:MAG: RNA methyltransferase [Alphaproteobacteria bacterium]|nr:RNA methyltransferase [Alphaproteobacteria bacterium]